MSQNLNEDQMVEMTEEEIKALTEQLISEMGQEGGTASKKGELMFFDEPLYLDDDEVALMSNSTEFAEGMKSAYKLAGIYTVLVNSGIDVETATDIIMNEHTMDNNIRLQKVVNEGVKMQANAIKSSQLG